MAIVCTYYGPVLCHLYVCVYLIVLYYIALYMYEGLILYTSVCVGVCKKSRSNDRLKFGMGIAIPIRRCFHNESKKNQITKFNVGTHCLTIYGQANSMNTYGSLEESWGNTIYCTMLKYCLCQNVQKIIKRTALLFSHLALSISLKGRLHVCSVYSGGNNISLWRQTA